nr:uncharacterized mitochondrial protein AtMg00810-like [Tanacetum cinerariifolium]
EVKRIFRYLRGTVNTGLWYSKGSGFELTGFSDADYAGCKDTFKSTFVGAQFLGEKLAKPTEKHLKEVKRIFRYLRGTVNTSLWYTKDSGFELTGLSDTDYAGCKDTFKSTSGGARFLGEKLIISALQAHTLLSHGCEGFLATIHDTTSDVPSIHDQPIVSKFSDVFSDELPGIPPVREVEFNIELILGA